jgi:hypothetical protein
VPERDRLLVTVGDLDRVTDLVKDVDRVRVTEVVGVGFKLGGTVGGPLRLLVTVGDLDRVTDRV